MNEFDAAYPKASGTVGGLQVREHVPNTGSISASLLEYEILPGIREVSMSHFGGLRSVFYAADDFLRGRKLAEQISESKQINPLIIVVDNEGPYILEGAHRYGALYELGVKSFPALVVIDTESVGEKTTVAWVRKTCKFAQKKAYKCTISFNGEIVWEGESQAASPAEAASRFWWRVTDGNRLRISKLKERGYECECVEVPQVPSSPFVLNPKPPPPEKTLFD